MKKYFLIIATIVSLVIIACGKSTNPLWGMWILQTPSPVRTEVMFNDDNTGFVFMADEVRFETTWTQDTLLHVKYKDTFSSNTGLGLSRSYSVTLDGNNLKLKDTLTGEVTEYTRFVE